MPDISVTLIETIVTATVTNPAATTASVGSSPIAASLVDGIDVTADVTSTPVTATLVNGGTVTATVTETPVTVTVISGGIGDVVGPASAVDSNFAAFNATTGKLLKDSGYNSASFEAADATIIKSGNASWIDLTDGGETTLHSHGASGGDISGTGVVGRVARFVTDTKTIEAAALIAPATNILTLTATAASTLALNITAAKTLTLTAADNYTLTIPATGTAALLDRVGGQTFTTAQTVPSLTIGTPYNANVLNTLKTGAVTWTALTGTVSTSGTTITGLGTSFLTDFKKGDAIGIDNLSGSPTPSFVGIVTNITSNTSMTTDRTWGATSGSGYRRGSPLLDWRTASDSPIFVVSAESNFGFGTLPGNLPGGGLSRFGTSSFGDASYVETPNGRGNIAYSSTVLDGALIGTRYLVNSGQMTIQNTSQRILLQANNGFIVSGIADYAQLTVKGFTTQTLPTGIFIDNTAATNAVRNVLQLETQSTGTAANGLGAGLLFSIETATASTNQNAGLVSASWVDATNATRKAKLSLSAYDTAQRTGIEIEADGTNPNIRLLGDTWWEGEGFGLPYGSLYGNDIAWTQAAAVQNTWYEISDADIADGELNLVTHDGSGKLTVTKAGRYLINYHLTVSDSGVGKEIQSAISVSGTESAQGQDHEVLATANEKEGLASTAILDLAANATIEISVRTIDTGTPDISVESINVSIIMVGGT